MSRLSWNNNSMQRTQPSSENLRQFLQHFIASEHINNSELNFDKKQDHNQLYSIQQFTTFLLHMPLHQATQLTTEERRNFQLNHKIMVEYLKKMLSNKGKKGVFGMGQLMEVIEEETDAQLLTDICERLSEEDVVSTVGCFIIGGNNAGQSRQYEDVLSYLRTFIRPQM